MDTNDHTLEQAYTVNSRPSQARPSSRRARVLLFAVVVAAAAGFPVTAGFDNVHHCLSTSNYMRAPAAPVPASGDTDFDWQSLGPSTDIEWTPCYDGQQCARLLLPLDYQSNGTSNATTAIALRMIPARDRANYKGSILINPGGPGGSGTKSMELGGPGQIVSTIVGDSFDVLGFDPRGIGASTPRLDCFATASERSIWSMQEGSQLLNASDDALLNFHAARAKVEGDRCAQLSVVQGDVARFMGTASVATDMLKITEKLGQEKLQYWGFSYGTVLGQYFAAMYPDKVGRMILDGVYDGNDYRAPLRKSSLVDNEAVIDSLFTFCHQAGPLECPLYESTPSAIRDRYYGVLESLKRNPIPVPLAESPSVLTHKLLVDQIVQGAYHPLQAYEQIADTIRAIETANQTTLVTLADGLVARTRSASTAALVDNGLEAFLAVECGDADADAQPFNRTAFQAFFDALMLEAPTAAPLEAAMLLGCTQWPIRAAWRYTGPLAAQNTSHPILVVQPKFDPVCPLRDALAVRERYGGAGLLVQDSYGHCSTSAPSVCTAKAVKAYFEEGTLPGEGTVCEPDVLPFVGRVARSGVQSRSEEDEKLLDALSGLSKAVPMFGARPW